MISQLGLGQDCKSTFRNSLAIGVGPGPRQNEPFKVFTSLNELRHDWALAPIALGVSLAGLRQFRSINFQQRPQQHIRPIRDVLRSREFLR